MALSTEDKAILDAVANFMYKVINRVASDDPNNDGRLTREGMKTALQQQLTSDAGSTYVIPHAW